MATSELIQIQTVSAPAPKPRWLRAKAPMGEQYHELKMLARSLDLHTVCESAHCPNIGQRAKVMLLNFVQQAAVAHIEILRGAAAIPAEGLQRALDHLRLGAGLHIADHRSDANARSRRTN